jgi:hypothetical protein
MTYRVTLADFLEAQRLHLGWKRWLIFALAVSLACFFAIRECVDSKGRIDWLLVAALIAVLISVIWYALTFGITRRWSKLYWEHKVLHEDVTMTFDATGIQWTSSSGSFKLSWNDVFNFKQSSELILVYQSSMIMHVVPKRVFANESVLQEFLHFLETREGEICDGDNQASPGTSGS